MLTDIVITALISAFIILLMTKLGIRDFVIERSPKLISKMFNCDFCLSFWTNMLIAVFAAIAFSYLPFIMVPIFSVSITRILI